MSVPDGGDEGADDWFDALLELELSRSVEVVGGDDPNGDGFCGELSWRGLGEMREPEPSVCCEVD
jgi:hypothetical protein